MSGEVQSIVPVLGHFHPLLVHLPIGGLIVLAFLELVARWSRFRNAAHSSKLILAVTSGGAAVAAMCGWVLCSSAHYDAQLLRWHQWSGTAVALGCALTLVLNIWSRPAAYRWSLGVTMAILAFASHLGGSMTHGRGFLTRHAPSLDRPFMQANAATKVVRPHGTHAEAGFFTEFVQPVLRQHCVSCHGPEKQEGDLRLDNLDYLRKGGISGPALVASRAQDSLLIQRLLLPRGDDEQMPPDGREPLMPLETALLQWWIDSGAL
jgi:uncharacterized membrane protein